MSYASRLRYRSSTAARLTLSRGSLAALLAGCAPADPGESTGSTAAATTTTEASTGSPTGDAATTPTTSEASTQGSGDVTSAASTSTASTSTTSTSEASTSEASTSESSTTGPVGCTKNVVLMGYWPPTNEMLRPWSTDPAQNPDGWIGADWGGYGYDVHSFFPEFPPDGDPTNDDIGDPGAVGSPDFDLRVDYQATSKDFWRLVDEYQPIILVTTSRGGDIGWEIEALEGGHGLDNPGGPAQDWLSDAHGAEHQPTKSTTEARSWDAISEYRQGNTLPSQLPLEVIAAATEPLGITSVVIDQQTSGNFLSGFLGLHGVYYNQLAPHNVAAGHIHVGYGLPVADASALLEATLHAVLQAHPADSVDCP
ncbi:hypothetical protein OV079_09505 [Nannocystis pusilla]|uniref:Uncharacterized protein n=1 Tax=Nannocystis pusilla TaxID=889268 RepID=A0A9X3ESG5_9BACT|nr:hypothetical protein [Nannocystis pusilla]MCY1005796.1 hypothetical protein [Nannocystis pusilla]